MDEQEQALVNYLVSTGSHPDDASVIAANVYANPQAPTSQAYINAVNQKRAKAEALDQRGREWGEFLQKPIDDGIVAASSGPQNQAQLDNARGALNRSEDRMVQEERDAWNRKERAQLTWVQPKQKAQQASAQLALSMLKVPAPLPVNPQVALDTSTKLLAPLHRDSFLGVAGEDDGDFAQHGVQAAAAKGQQNQMAPQTTGALGSLYKGN